MKDYHINVFYSEEDGGYIADIPDLRFCSAFGATPEEAVREVTKAKTAWLKVAKTNPEAALSARNLSEGQLSAMHCGGSSRGGVSVHQV
jgi:predicted RNase H-like HicB family nuclease